MTLSEHQQRLVDDLAIIPDAQERLAEIVEQARRLPSLAVAERIEGNRVAGCQSQVWLVAKPRDGAAFFRCEADSPLVKGLVGLLCRLYSGYPQEEIASVEPVLLDELRIRSNLSPTRQRGLAAVRARIRQLAVVFTAPPAPLTVAKPAP